MMITNDERKKLIAKSQTQFVLATFSRLNMMESSSNLTQDMKEDEDK